MTRATGTATDLGDLRSAVSGPVHPGGGIGGLREVGRHPEAGDGPPVAVVGVRTTSDVRAAVRWAVRRGLAVAVHGTGHGARSYRDCLVLSTRRLNTCMIDAQRRSATVGAGVRWDSVVTAAAPHRLAPLNGSSLSLGVVGYTLGGGVGALARQYGFAADHVRSFELVTADGRCRHVSQTSDPDLYWAVLGAPGSFGVVTQLEFDLMWIHKLYAGHLCYRIDRAPEVLHSFRAWTADLPDATTASIAVVPGADGGPVVHLRFAHLGDSETGADVLSVMRGAGPVLVDTVRDVPYPDADIFGNSLPPGRGFSTGVFLDTLDADAVDALLAAVRARHSPSGVEVRHLGGALSRLPIRGNCVGGRDAEYAVAVPAACDQILDALAPWTSDVLPVNYLQSAAHVSGRLPWTRADHARLRQLKRAHDPANTFRVGPTVRP